MLASTKEDSLRSLICRQLVAVNSGDSATLWAERSLDYAQKTSNHSFIFDSYLYLGALYTQQKVYDRATEQFLAALRYKDSLQLSSSAYSAYKQLAVIFFRQKNYEKAISYFEEAVAAAERENNPDLQQRAYVNAASAYSKMKQFDLSKQYFEKALQITNLNTQVQGGIWLNLGNLYQRTTQFSEAKKAYKQALNLFEERHTNERAKAYNGLTDLAMKEGQFQIAEEYAQQALTLSQKSQRIYSLIYTYTNLTRIYQEQNDYRKAFWAYQEERQLKDSLQKVSDMRTLNELEEKYQNEKKQSEIDRLEQEKQLLLARERAARLQNTLLLGGGLSLALILFLGMWLQRIRHRRREEQQRYELEKRQQLIRQYKTQLTEHTQRLLQKNTLLSELHDEVVSLKIQQDEERSERKSSLQELISSRILTAEDWKDYKQTFTRVYPTFFQQLDGLSPSLSQAERRTAALIKLSLSIAEMSTILGISEDSVRKSRYRLRQRLNLKTDEKLIESLSQLS
ncbi:MAG: tetratricopeptide repeat protein [Bacteroidota bacterium]